MGHKFRLYSVAALTCVVIGVSISVALHVVDTQFEQDKRQLLFTSSCSSVMAAVAQDLQGHIHNAETLADVFIEPLRRDTFRVVANTMIRQSPGTLGFSWNRHTVDSDRAELEQENTDYYNWYYSNSDPTYVNRTYHFQDVVSNNTGTRPEYLIIHYIEPLESNKGAYLFDLYSSTSRNRTFRSSRASNTILATPRINLVQQGHSLSPVGVLFVAPIASPSEDFMVAVMNFALAMESVFARLEDDASLEGLYIKLMDITPDDTLENPDGDFLVAGGIEQTFMEDEFAELEPRMDSTLFVQETMDTAGRVWEATCMGSPVFSPVQTNYSLILLTFAVVLGCALAIVVVGFIKTNQHKRELKESNLRTHKNLLSFVCHELRNPLHIIACITEDEANFAENRPLLKSAVEMMQSLLNGFIDFDMIGQVDIRFNVQPVDIKVLGKSLFDQSRLLSDSRINWEFDCSNALKDVDTMLLDKVRLQQLMMNGFTNSIKHTTSGTVTFALDMKRVMEKEKDSFVTIKSLTQRPRTSESESNNRSSELALFPQTGVLVVQVLDTGTGINQDKEFYFGMADETSKSELPSNGIGLFVSMEITRLMNGSLTLRNRTDGVQGCEYKIQIPVKYRTIADLRAQQHNESLLQLEGDDGQQAKASFAGLAPVNPSKDSKECSQGGPAVTPSPPTRDLLVFHCDDEPINRSLMRRMLQSVGVTRSKFFEDGDCIVDAIREEIQQNGVHSPALPDIIILDIVMRNMDGTEACRLIREMGVTCMIIAATGNDDNDYLDKGFDLVFVKPFQSATLETALRQAVKDTHVVVTV